MTTVTYTVKCINAIILNLFSFKLTFKFRFLFLRNSTAMNSITTHRHQYILDKLICIGHDNSFILLQHVCIITTTRRGITTSSTCCRFLLCFLCISLLFFNQWQFLDQVRHCIAVPCIPIPIPSTLTPGGFKQLIILSMTVN